MAVISRLYELQRKKCVLRQRYLPKVQFEIVCFSYI